MSSTTSPAAGVGIDDEHLTRALSDPPLAVWGDDGIDRLDEPYERVEFDCGLVDVADRRRGRCLVGVVGAGSWSSVKPSAPGDAVAVSMVSSVRMPQRAGRLR